MIELARTMSQARDAIRLLQSFLKETAYAQAPEASENIEHLGKLVFTIMNQGHLWIAYKEQQPVGLLMAVIEPNMWIPRHRQMRELVWYVKPEHRKTSIGGRLFKTFCDHADNLIEQGQITGYFTTRMPTTAGIDLERRGFRLTEQTYLKEQK